MTRRKQGETPPARGTVPWTAEGWRSLRRRRGVRRGCGCWSGQEQRPNCCSGLSRAPRPLLRSLLSRRRQQRPWFAWEPWAHAPCVASSRALFSACPFPLSRPLCPAPVSFRCLNRPPIAPALAALRALAAPGNKPRKEQHVRDITWAICSQFRVRATHRCPIDNHGTEVNPRSPRLIL
jgi:hypothetical protein